MCTYINLNGEAVRYYSSDVRDNHDVADFLQATAWEKVKDQPIKRKKVRKYILSGNSILEDCGYIPGDSIPIIPVYGKRWYIDGIERCMGHVRLSKDAQVIKNMGLSKLAETSAYSSVEKPIVTPEQVQGHQNMWARDNIDNYPYLVLNPLMDASGNIVSTGPSAYTKSPVIPPALAGLLQLADQDMKDLLGNPEAGEKIVSNISAKAIATKV